MPIIPLKYLPGVCKSNSPYSDKTQGGRYSDMNNIRFTAGYPESINKFSLLDQPVSQDTTGAFTYKGIFDWRDNSGNVYAAAGTVSHLYYYPQTNSITVAAKVDITPLRSISTSTLTNPLDTTSGSTTVTVHHTAHGLSTGDYVVLVTGTAVGGIQPTGVFAPITKVDANTYTVVNTSAATGSVTGGGGTVTYTYYRVTLSNPFDTTISSPTVTVHHTAHGAVTGDYVTIAASSAVGGITPNGEYVITKVDANTYTITHGSNATSSVTGGGGSPNFRYNIATGVLNTNSRRIWSLDRYGQQLLASPYNDTIYIWDPTIGGRAYPMYNAPSNVLAMFVTPERFVFALGKTSNAMIVSWPDQSDYTQWTASATNTANTRTLQEGSFLVGGIAVRDGISLVWSNTACYQFNYTGDNFIYNSSVTGKNCGLAGPMARAVLQGIGYWFSGNEFWQWNGSAQRLPSDDIREYVVQDFYDAGRTNCVVGAHTAKKEIWMAYTSSTEVGLGTYLPQNTRYVIYHTDQNCWASGGPGVNNVPSLNITSWIDKNLFDGPLVATFYQPNTPSAISLAIADSVNGATAIGMGTPYLTGSPMDINNGEYTADVFTFYPDFQFRSNAVLYLYILIQNYPTDAVASYGPYNLVADDFVTSIPKIDVRLNGKLVGFKIVDPSTGYATGSTTNWRLGLPRIEAQPAGARR